MATGQSNLILRHIRKLAAGRALTALSDRELLAHFARRHDESAFETLVARHGPMVFRLCSRVLGNSHDAEDVFQATFLVLARQAGARRWREYIANWLYEVAYHLALNARTARLRRTAREKHVSSRSTVDPLTEITGRELLSMLDEELARLPKKLRAPLLLCCLEGCTRDEAAQRLGCSLGSLKSRLERGRERLRSRLTRRGLTLSSALVASLLTETVGTAVVPTALFHTTVQSALALVGTKGAADIATASATIMAQTWHRGMFLTKVKNVVILFALTAGIATTGMVLGHGLLTAPPIAPAEHAPMIDDEQEVQPKVTQAPNLKEHQRARTDAFGDPLPPGVLLRLGTPRLWSVSPQFMAFSPDGKMLAAEGSLDGVQMWEVGTGKELWRYESIKRDRVSALAFSFDGKLLAWGCRDKTLRLCDARNGRELHRFQLVSPPTNIAFAPSGRYLAAGTYPQGVQLWDLPQGKLTREWNVESPHEIVFSKASAELIVMNFGKQGSERIFHFLDLESGKKVREQKVAIEIDKNGIHYQGNLSPDGRYFALPTVDGKSIGLLDPSTGKEVRRTMGEASWPALVVFSADGRVLTSTSKDDVIRVWDTASGKMIYRLKGPASGFRSIALSQDGKILALARGTDQSIHMWDLAKGKELHEFGGHRNGPLAVAFAPDGKSVFTLVQLEKWCLRQWDSATGKELRVMRPQPGQEADIEARFSVLSRGGGWLALVGSNGTLHLWNAATGKEICRWKVPTLETKTIYPDRVIKTPRPAILPPVFSSDEKVLFAGDDRVIRRWETATGKELTPLNLPGEASVTYCLPAPDGRFIFVSDYTKGMGRSQAYFLDLDNGQVLRRLDGYYNAPHPCVFSPDCKSLAMAQNRGIVLLEVATGQERGRLTIGYASGIAFSPDNQLLAIGANQEERLLLWPLSSDRALGCLTRQDLSMQIRSLSFSPDGRKLALSGMGNTALICDVASLMKPTAPEKISLSADELENLWAHLSGANAAAAYRAILRLAESTPDSVAFLKKRLRMTPTTDDQRIKILIGNLDSDEFSLRQKASDELESLGARAERPLRRALEGSPSLESRTRVERLLEKIRLGSLPPLEVVNGRIIEALEYQGSPAARQVILDLSNGAPEARLTQEAKASLTRLRQRTPREP